MREKELFKRGSTSYRILVLTVVFVVLAISVLAPIFLVDGGNRMLGIILAAVIGVTYLFLLLVLIYDWMKSKN